jgi:hypothetical protein
MRIGRLECHLDSLEPRELLASTPFAIAHDEARGSALIGSIQGTETAAATEFQLVGTGTVQPLGDVSGTGFLLYGGPHGTTGAVGGQGSLTLSNGQGSLTLAIESHGFSRVPHQPSLEEIRVTARTASATGSASGIRVQGSINLVNPILLFHAGSTNEQVPLSAQIHLKPSR